MKKIINKLSFVGNNKSSAVIAMLIVSLIVLGCGGKPEMPAESVSQSLVKSTLSDFADAIDKGDFKAFREKTSAEFQKDITEEKLKATFKDFMDKKELIVPILREAAGKDTKFSPTPSIRDADYVLETKGETETADNKVKIDNGYVWRDGVWKLLEIKVELK